VNKEGRSFFVDLAVAQNRKIFLDFTGILAQKVLSQDSIVYDSMLILLNLDGRLSLFGAEAKLLFHLTLRKHSKFYILVDSKMVLLELFFQRSDVFQDALTEVVQVAFHLDHARINF
jgi:hypothetical protein